MIGKVFRLLSNFKRNLFSEYRKALIRLKYPGVTFNKKTTLEKNCDIICTIGSEIKIFDSFISKGSTLKASDGGQLMIQDTFIGINCVIEAKEKVSISKHCLIAEMVVIRDHDHAFQDTQANIYTQGFNTSPIIIQENVWLGAKCTILKSSEIGKNTVVGANSVLKGTADANSIYVGSPAKKIKSK